MIAGINTNISNFAIFASDYLKKVIFFLAICSLLKVSYNNAIEAHPSDRIHWCSYLRNILAWDIKKQIRFPTEQKIILTFFESKLHQIQIYHPHHININKQYIILVYSIKCNLKYKLDKYIWSTEAERKFHSIHGYGHGHVRMSKKEVNKCHRK